MFSLMECRDTRYDWQIKENQKELMGKLVLAVEGLNYVDDTSSKATGDRFYFVHEPSMLSSQTANYPYIKLMRCYRKIDPSVEDNGIGSAKVNTMSIELHSAEDRGCYVEDECISVYTTNNRLPGALEKLDISFMFRIPNGKKKDIWKKEMAFIEKKLNEFERKGF